MQKDALIDIMTLAGHRSFGTAQKYLDLAQTLRAGGVNGTPFFAALKFGGERPDSLPTAHKTSPDNLLK